MLKANAILALVLPASLCAQLPKFEAALFAGPTLHAVTNGPNASKYDSLNAGFHLGGMIFLRLGDHVALRASAKRQTHDLRPTTSSTSSGTITFAGKGVFFTTAAGPTISFYPIRPLPKLRLSAFFELARVYDQSELTCSGTSGPINCPDASTDDSGRNYGVGARYPIGDFAVFGEYRRESFSVSASGITLGFHALSIGVMR
jgi:hypothetical protein